ncbi:MAG: tetratricopeptide repeat-containing sensor histidine kinase [Bacteroidales bacterium]|nr:tetratricopeptide repeat-containing sensor histidine kinase [Bacteroidales bacterium]
MGKKNLLIIIIIILLGLDGNAQISISDSVINSLSSLPDSVALTRLEEHALNELNRSLKTGLTYADKRMELARQGNNMEAIAETWHIYGNLYGSSGLFDDAGKYYIRALALYDSLGMTGGKASILHNLGLVHFNNNDTSECIEYYNKSIELRKQSLSDRRTGDELTTLGEVYLSYGNHQKSRQCLLEGLDFYSDTLGYPRKLENYAYLFDNDYISGHPEVTRWIDSMAAENDILEYPEYASMINLRLGKVFLRKEDPETAKQYIDNTDFKLILDKEVVDSENTYIELAELFKKKGNETEAINYSLKHHKLINELRDIEIGELASSYNVRLNIRASEEEIEWSQEQNELILQRIKLEKTISLIIYIALAAILLTLAFLIYHTAGIRKTNKKLEIRKTKLQEAYESSTRYKEKILKTRENKNVFFSMVSLKLSKPFEEISERLSEISSYLDSHNKDLRLKKMMEGLYNTAADIEKRLERILLWSKLQRSKYYVKPVTININDFMHEMLPSLLGSTLRKDIKIRFDIDPGINLSYDRHALKTIINILAENSIEHSPAGTDIIFRAVKAENGCLLSLTDFGKGIPGDLQNKLFDVSRLNEETAEQNSNKTGLGLLIASYLAERNNSILSLESKENSGTTFFIHIKDNDRK